MAETPEKNEPIQELTSPGEITKQGDRPKIGVYTCQCGGNISDIVHTDEVANALEGEGDVVVSREFIFMCSDAGQELVKQDIREKGINRVVIGACSPFLHEQTFRKAVAGADLNPYLYYHVGIREQDSWVHHDRQEATELAIRLMGTGIAKARLLDPLYPIKIDAKRHVLVIGGGIAGLRSALATAKTGLNVTLVEKSHFLGGHVAQWEHVFPTEEDARTLVHDLIKQVVAEPNIMIHTGAEVVASKGYVGDFNIHVRQQPRGVRVDFDQLDEAIAACPVEVPDEFNFGLTKRKAIYRSYEGSIPSSAVIDWENCLGSECGKCLAFAPEGLIDLDGEPHEFDVNVGSVVVATGFRPYEPFPGEFGYGKFPEVVTLPQLERILDPSGPTGGKLELNGHPIRSIAMIHCVGSRQIDGIHQPQSDGKVNDYCSRVCCTATLSAANQIRERFPNVHVYDAFEDIRTYGRGHEDYYTDASKNQVTFLRYHAEEIPEVMQAPSGEENALIVKVRDHLTWGQDIELPVDMVVLAVGMMPNPVQDLIGIFNISQGNDRFLLEVHPKLRPVETAIAGVVLAGTAQGPMNIRESSASGQAAASKVIGLLHSGVVELEPYVAHVNPERCEGSGECVKYCPQDDAIHLETFTEEGRTFQRAVVTEANCNGCGVCVSVCPTRALDVQGWTLDQYEAMVEAMTMEIPVAKERVL